jgi:hypothetical protein
MGKQRRETRCAQRDGHKDGGLLQKSLYSSFCGLKTADPRLVQEKTNIIHPIFFKKIKGT